MKKIILLITIVSAFLGGWYYLTLNNGSTERIIYYDRDIKVGFLGISNDKLLGFERLEFEKLNNETGPEKEYKMVRLFTDDFQDADFTSVNACTEERIANGSYEIYVTSDIDQTINSDYTIENIDWETKISRAEDAARTEEVKMITVQDYLFMYHRINDIDCWNYVQIEGWVTPNHKLKVSIQYYGDSALDDFEDIVDSLEFLNVN